MRPSAARTRKLSPSADTSPSLATASQWNLTTSPSRSASSRPRKLSPAEPTQCSYALAARASISSYPCRPHHPSAIAARLGPPDHAHRGKRAQVLDQHLVHGELRQPDSLAQP